LSSSAIAHLLQWNAMMHIVNNKGPPNVPEHISKDARDFLERCWERDPYRRPNCDRLLQHPFIAGTSRRPLIDDSVSPNAVRMHPAVGSHPSPIQEEAHDHRSTPERTPGARTCEKYL
jgi:serine/threonine protein kinase